MTIARERPAYSFRTENGFDDCMPPAAVLDTYQRTVKAQIIFDDDGQTIRSKAPLRYMVDGLLEELGELTEPDRHNPDYSRIGVFFNELSNGSDTYTPPFPLGVFSEEAERLHQKEFGDVSWYMTNLLSLRGLRLSLAVHRGRGYRQATIGSQLNGDSAHYAEAENLFPGLMLLPAIQSLQNAAQETARYPEEASNDRLCAAAGHLVLGMNFFLQQRLNTTYESVLRQNIDKIEKRKRDGTVFDKTGGDIR